jgi:hypothetical protein
MVENRLHFYKFMFLSKSYGFQGVTCHASKTESNADFVPDTDTSSGSVSETGINRELKKIMRYAEV